MENAFASVSNVRLPGRARLLPSSWCPDKDILALITHSGGRDKLSLWKMQGAKKWEVDIESDQAGPLRIVDIAWSPDGTLIAVALDPPAVSLHYIENGRQRSISQLDTESMSGDATPSLTNIWWLRENKKHASSMSDIFRRRGVVTGSAHSVFKGLPLLDPYHDESLALNSRDLFGFPGSTPRPAARNVSPTEIATWPSLPVDDIMASVKPTRPGKQKYRPGEEYDEPDDTNVDSVLLLADSSGRLHGFLDGFYSMGAFTLGTNAPTVSMYQDQARILYLHSQVTAGKRTHTNLQSSVVQFPLLGDRRLRDVAQVSSSAKHLTHYAMRVLDDMRKVWFGSDTQSGARELGPKWVRAFEARQKEQFGEDDPNAILDMTGLLATGHGSEALSDYLGSGEQMSERSMAKWDQTVSEALIKLRDASEKRFVPACQRIHILLEEVRGWSILPQYASWQLDKEEIDTCLLMIKRAIILANWLCATARKELIRFKDFLNWLRYEIAKANATNDPPNLPPARYDILEVNDYLTSGLVVSSIDKWFMGPLPRFDLKDVVIPVHDLDTSIQIARNFLSNPDNITWPPKLRQQDHNHLDRNLPSLMQELATRCHRIFVEASKAASRSAATISTVTPVSSPGAQAGNLADAPVIVRERTVPDPSEVNGHIQYVAYIIPHGYGGHLCMGQLKHRNLGGRSAISAAVTVLNSTVESNDDSVRSPVDILDAEFFDDSVMVLIYRFRGGGPTCIATMNYIDLVYETLDAGDVGNIPTREELFGDVMQRLSKGEVCMLVMLSCGRFSLTFSRALLVHAVLAHRSAFADQSNPNLERLHGRECDLVCERESWTQSCLCLGWCRDNSGGAGHGRRRRGGGRRQPRIRSWCGSMIGPHASAT
ncbi:hypothetical protein K474DRAFT_1659827 [Panus rudis PR-1116 ss-1]|nr:hypothetical protein K474DRAFT_1659827 [Panus rudis PR-1116 ss-1]